MKNYLLLIFIWAFSFQAGAAYYAASALYDFSGKTEEECVTKLVETTTSKFKDPSNDHSFELEIIKLDKEFDIGAVSVDFSFEATNAMGEVYDGVVEVQFVEYDSETRCNLHIGSGNELAGVDGPSPFDDTVLMLRKNNEVKLHLISINP